MTETMPPPWVVFDDLMLVVRDAGLPQDVIHALAEVAMDTIGVYPSSAHRFREMLRPVFERHGITYSTLLALPPPWCDVCGLPAEWREGNGWAHSAPDQFYPNGVPRLVATVLDRADHEITACVEWNLL